MNQLIQQSNKIGSIDERPPLSAVSKNRIGSIDLLKGLVMVIMALDHTRDFIHFSAHYFNPIDPTHTNLPLYFTRWITDYCAPTFSFLAGLSAFIAGRRKTTKELSAFLFKRGLWLVFIELTIVTFAWFFNIHFSLITLAVIWALGISMILLAALVYLPNSVILIFSCIVIFGHNLLDNVHFPGSLIWGMLHEYIDYKISNSITLEVFYPVIPWVATMSLGYSFGPLYSQSYNAARRRKLLNILGFSAILLFVIIRWTNVYGDPLPFQHYDTPAKTFMSFFNVNKYPPSLSYLLMTLGPVLIFLANSESWKGRIVSFFSVFGRVPFFYYVLHLYLIHLIAMALAQFSGFGWHKMITTEFVSDEPALKGFGFSLWVVYLVWALVIMALYPLCKKFDIYKQSHKEKWWLSYL